MTVHVDSVLQSDVRFQLEHLVKILKRIFMQRGDMEEEHKKGNYVRDCTRRDSYHKIKKKQKTNCMYNLFILDYAYSFLVE